MNCKRFSGMIMGVLFIIAPVSRGFAMPVQSNLPPTHFSAPPQLVMVPNTSVFVAPNMEGDLLFYHGHWWRPYQGKWYRSTTYHGPWRHIAHDKVPYAFFGVLFGFHRAYRQHDRFSHAEVETNWQKWEREHHFWERQSRHDTDSRHLYRR